MIAAAMSLLGRLPIWAWAIAALLAWGGWNRLQARHAAADAAAAAASARDHAAAAQGEREARAIEQQRARVAQEKADAYARERQRAAAAAADARTELDRLRDALAAASAAGAASSPAGSAGGADGASRARLVVGECSAALHAVAEAADTCDAKLTGLQEWVRGVLPSSPSRESP